MKVKEVANFHKSPKSELKTTIEFERTHGRDLKFVNIIKELDQNLFAMYNHNSYKFDVDIKVDHIDTVVLASIKNITIGGGCFKALDANTAEVKRLFVNPYFRGLGVASGILDEIEAWAKELNFGRLMLETGELQEQAIKLFERHGFLVTDSFGPYIGVAGSVCMAKRI
ncbi:GNAT family N-acetyltransferase [Pedobacter sp. SYSU D00535]|uniref:GNAT family N-acetyltransferase n=1 Tax=Pedobacter sp. SYSU D00535 TaxID=2810308 RepID=UPI001A977A23|nr:GNAT family N-acetyltransferase [Pedobacter sp. SYSU D00535]